MLSRKHSIDGKGPFDDSALFEALTPEVAGKLAMIAGDVSLVLDPGGQILDATANPDDFPDFRDWIGRDWLDTVTVESRPKVMEMLAGARRGQTQHWRQVNHPTSAGDVPVRYALVSIGQGAEGGGPGGNGTRAGAIAFGRDMRDAAALQQRMIQAQQSLERDYLRLRHVEARYRLLFDVSAEPVLVVEAEGTRIREANPAAHALLRAKPGSLAGTRLAALFARPEREPLVGFLGSALATSTLQPVELELANGEQRVTMSATGFHQRGGHYLLVRLSAAEEGTGEHGRAILEVLEAMPDAFVLADAQMAILAANLAFVELVGAASADQVRGRRLGELVGRPGIDMELIDAQIERHGIARNVPSVIGAEDGFAGEPVELSAVRTGGERPVTGFVIRAIGRRLSDLPSAIDQPRSVEQLTELVGRMSLKDIVRESTDLIERLCIEAALTYTSNNRASAAEILGLSRQSLYAKLHRYDLGNLSFEND